MKVLHLCLGSFYIDNYSYQENLLPKYHKILGYDVSIIASLLSFDESGDTCYLPNECSYINEYGIPITRIDYLKTFKKISKFLRIYNNTYELIVKDKPDIIFIHGCQFWDIRAVIKYKKSNPNIKIYADNHADCINSARNLPSKYILHKIIWKSGIKKLLPQCEILFGVTPNRCNFLMEMYNVPKEKIELLVMGADSEKIDFHNKDIIRKKIRLALCLDDDDFVLITGGKIDIKKNIHHLIQAINKINDNKLKLIVFGTPTEDMKDIIKNYSMSPLIINIGWISSDVVYKYFFASDLAVFPGTHSVLWEQAVGIGIPCVFKKWDGMQHVDLGGNCDFISNGNVEEITKTILDIFNNKNKYNQMKNMAIEKGIPYFSYREISKHAIGK